MSLYNRVAHGNVFYIHSIERDIEQGRLRFHFLGDPEKPDIVRTLTFTGVREFSEQREEDFIEDMWQSVIGLNERLQSGEVEYEIILDEVVMNFATSEQPEVVDLIQFRPYQEQG